MPRINAMVKDGGFEKLLISPELLGKLAKNIEENGSEMVHLMNRSIEIVGFMVTGKQTGERVIVINGQQEDKEDGR